MPIANLTQSGSVGAVTIQGQASITTVGQIGHDPPVSAAVAGSITSSGGAPVDYVCAIVGHGFAGSEVVDVYWDGGQRYAMTVESINGADECTLTDSANAGGDAMPADGTDITVCEHVTVDTDFVGNLLKALACVCPAKAQVLFWGSGDTVLLSVPLIANWPYVWMYGSGHTNPLAGDTVAYATVTQGDTAATSVKIGINYDSGA